MGKGNGKLLGREKEKKGKEGEGEGRRNRIKGEFVSLP